jgi:hypothetical protein
MAYYSSDDEADPAAYLAGLQGTFVPESASADAPAADASADAPAAVAVAEPAAPDAGFTADN